MSTMGKYLLTRVQKTFLWIGCTWIGVYVAYKYWKKRKVKAIDESFKKMLEFVNKPQKRVVISGLKDAGKTVLTNQIRVLLNENDFSYTMPPQPTKGVIVSRLEYDNCYYNIWEVGDIYRSYEMMRLLLDDIDLLVFVVDSNKHKLPNAAPIFRQLMTTIPQLHSKPILIVANKQDSSDALNLEQVTEVLGLLEFLPTRKIELIGCQTEPLPCLPEGETRYKWYQDSVALVMKKIFSMAIS